CWQGLFLRCAGGGADRRGVRPPLPDIVHAAADQKDSQSSLSLVAGFWATGAASAAAGTVALGLAAGRGAAGALPSEATGLGGAATGRAGAVVVCSGGRAAGEGVVAGRPGTPLLPEPFTR